jgi:hypothetical protein
MSDQKNTALQQPDSPRREITAGQMKELLEQVPSQPTEIGLNSIKFEPDYRDLAQRINEFFNGKPWQAAEYVKTIRRKVHPKT